MTFSLAGRCARTGMLGCAVTTSSIAVGSRCSHARAGIGAALTQHRTDPRLGPLALELLARGCDAKTALAGVIAVAPHRDWRQIAIIDRGGRHGVLHRRACRSHEERRGHGRDCVAIANIVRSAEVPLAMVRSFEADSAAVPGGAPRRGARCRRGGGRRVQARRLGGAPRDASRELRLCGSARRRSRKTDRRASTPVASL